MLFQVEREPYYLQGYRLLYRPSGSAWLLQDIKAGSKQTAVLSELRRGTEYELKMRPYFKEFQGSDSELVVFCTPKEGMFFILTNSFSGFIQSLPNTFQLGTMFPSPTIYQFLYCPCCQLQLSDPNLISGCRDGAVGFSMPGVIKISCEHFVLITSGWVS